MVKECLCGETYTVSFVELPARRQIWQGVAEAHGFDKRGRVSALGFG